MSALLRMTCSPETRQALSQLLRCEVQNLYGIAYFIRCSRTDARKQLARLRKQLLADPEAAQRVFHAAVPGEQLIVEMVREISGRQTKRKTEAAFVSLDNLLRSTLTRPVAHDHVLLWEVKRSCLTAALGCLPITLRVAYVLTRIVGWSETRSADALAITEKAIKLRLLRADQYLDDYLAPRCSHIDRHNPCTCPGRMGIALDVGFIRRREFIADVPKEPYNADGAQNVHRLYAQLPRVQLAEKYIASFVDCTA